MWWVYHIGPIWDPSHVSKVVHNSCASITPLIFTIKTVYKLMCQFLIGEIIKSLQLTSQPLTNEIDKPDFLF
jgi:hypothetical protein